MSTRLDLVSKLVGSAQPLMPIADVLGMRLVSAAIGQATLAYDTDQKHANAMGTLHGGVLCSLADTAMGVAFYTVLDEDESLTTLELKINYLKPVWKGTLTASARVVKRGKTTGLVECDILDANNSLVARASSTYMAISGDQATNRMAPQKAD